MKIVDVATMRKIEATIDAEGISYDELMQRAGKTLADYTMNEVEAILQPRIMVIVGKGNNGGDGLVAARHLLEMRPDAVIQVYMLVTRDDVLTKAIMDTNIVIANIEDDKDRRVLKNMVASADLIIDALFGIGLKLPLSDDAKSVLRAIKTAIKERNSLKPERKTVNPAKPRQIPVARPIHVLAVDCPSGVDCDSGNCDSETLYADTTLTFIAVKQGLMQFPAAQHVGQLIMADCGVDDAHKALSVISDAVIDARYVRDQLPERIVDGHKGTYGRVLLACGSTQYIGAAALAAKGAYRSGTGLVTVATPRPVNQILGSQLLETTWLPLPHDMGILSKEAVPLIYEKIDYYDAMLIGSGLQNEKSTREFMSTLLSQAVHQKPINQRRIGFQPMAEEPHTDSDDTHKQNLPPLLIDADGLNILAGMDSWWENLPPETIITPHVGEMARLADMKNRDVVEHRWELALEKAKLWQVVVVLKGANTIIATPDGQRVVIPFKVDALATAGTGDILAGLITGFRAQGLDAFQASICGAYIHGLAGQMAGSQHGNRSVIASDVLAHIGQALVAIEQS